MIRRALEASALGALLALSVFAGADAVSAPPNDWAIAGPFGGTARSLAVDPHHAGVLLAGGMDSLLFRSRDAGDNWELLDFPKRNLSEISSLLIDPNDPSHYLAGMMAAGGGGLFESHDDGRTWTPVKKISEFGVRALAYAPSDPTEFVAGTLQGVWLSENSGKDWKRISDPDNLEMQGISALAVDSKDPKIIYAGTSHLPWKTTDGGKTWESIHTGMIDDSDVFSIFVDPANPSDILASACSGIYASGTRGGEWKKLLGIPNTSRRTHVIREDPSSENVIYAGTTTGLYKSLNHGATWKTLSDYQANTIVFDPSQPGRMYLAFEYEGLGRSDNGAETIQPINKGYVDRSISAVARAGDKLVAVETQEGDTTGIFESADRGENWSRLKDTHGLGGVHLKAITGLPSQSNILIASTPRHMFKSTDAGNLWKPLPVRIMETIQPPPPKAAPVRKTTRGRTATARATKPPKPIVKIHQATLSDVSALYAMKKGSEDLVLAATDLGLLVSSDAGERWTVAKMEGTPAVSAVWFAPDASGRMIARTAGGLFESKDCGETWQPLAFPLNAGDVNEIAIPGGDSTTLLAATRVGLYSSPDGGGKWYASQGGIPASTVTSVLFGGKPGLAYAVEYGQLYQTDDTGASWKLVRSALPPLRIRQLWMPDVASGRLYGITANLGILFRETGVIR
ncbi:MAG TPA: hypothetical protein VKX25_18265 [Bryobacteraceae bacterium]|nr:hypothetical protein [Bryobacteraceae bacterium]